MDTFNTLRSGDLIEWINSLPADDYNTYRLVSPNGAAAATAYHVRSGLADIAVTPVGVDHDGVTHYEATIHTHDNESDARECYAHNVRRNRQRESETAVDPQRAAMRQQGRDMGVPDALIDRVMPLVGRTMIDDVNDGLMSPSEAARRAVGDVRPVSGGPTGFYM